MTSTVPVRPLPALQQVNNSLTHWWQTQSPSDQCPHYNKSTTVSHTDDKHSPRPANARTTTSQQQSQSLMTSTVPARPMPALQQVNNSLRHWWQAQSPPDQCPHYNKSTTISVTDDKHSPRLTNAHTTTSQQQSQTLMTSTVPVRPMPALQQVNNSLTHWWQAQSPSGQCPHYNKSTTVSDTDDKHSLRHWWQAQSPSDQCPHYNKSTTISDTDDKHSPRPTNARTTTSQQQSHTLMTSTVPVRPMPALQQVNNSLRHWWQAQSQTLMTSTVPVRPMPALQHVNNSLTHWWQAQSPSDQCPHYNKSTTVSHTDDKHSPRLTNARTTTSQQQSQTLMTSTVPVRPMPALHVNNSLRH